MRRSRPTQAPASSISWWRSRTPTSRRAGSETFEALRLGAFLVFVSCATCRSAGGCEQELPDHPSLHFKRIGSVWSVRVGSQHRALGHDVADGIQWFWIGTHAEYDKLVG